MNNQQIIDYYERRVQADKEAPIAASDGLSSMKHFHVERRAFMQAREAANGKDALLDAAVAAWTALRIHNGEARQVCEAERDQKGLSATIWY
jgi:predicted RNase H-like nuclease